jgi:hypothetical protein
MVLDALELGGRFSWIWRRRPVRRAPVLTGRADAVHVRVLRHARLSWSAIANAPGTDGTPSDGLAVR